jgi:hypothetical protein
LGQRRLTLWNGKGFFFFRWKTIARADRLGNLTPACNDSSSKRYGADLDLLDLGIDLGASLPTAAPKRSIISLDTDGKLICSDPKAIASLIFLIPVYAGGDRPIPDLPIRVVVPPIQDSTTRIQR